MVFAIHRNYDENRHLSHEKLDVEDDSIYVCQKRKKRKLISAIKNEKALDPSLQTIADQEIENIIKKSQANGTVGRVSYYLCSLKGFYFYK